ncbi:DUF2933 domain-containing protein [Altererythrobacter lauratis]|uniref:DUF2933 domain-containing protein n=1 Tax=Alteraurantiacibacter lauratis TaxID=2054627 RepID=A0ABV7EFX0_9SPHN
MLEATRDPALVIIMCPLAHIFMHRGYSGWGAAAPHAGERSTRLRRR